MASNSNDPWAGRPRWRYLLLAVAICFLVGAVLAGLWQLPRLFSRLERPAVLPTRSVVILPAATLTPAVTQPTITHLIAEIDDGAGAITFRLAAEVPPGRHVAEVLLWYDTEVGHRLQRTTGPLPNSLSLSHQLDAAQEGLTRTLTTTAELDYWWLVRDTAGESVRAGGTAFLGPALQALVTTPTPEPPPVDFTWAVSESRHFQFYYMPGTAAERDLPQLATLTEASLARISAILEMGFDGQMSIYFVPRIFWQGGAAYGGKVQLISYLDRNYTGIETWTYFTHEGTHALAQDLLQPEDNSGGPDGVLVEGLAVWASGGHYRQEPLDAWAAVVAGSNGYIPLATLRAGPFYDFQHEISYLEGASFVKFLVEQYGLDKLKELYGLATGDAAHDEALVQRLYSTGYDALEADWLAYLASLPPTPEQAETWHLQVRSFDLMRRYETELDPDARLLPSGPPPEWTNDTLKVFVHRAGAPVNVVLETAFIAAQERLHGDDPDGAEALLKDVEAALDAGGTLTRPSLQARQAILDLAAVQDRAVLRADATAYRETLDPAYALSLGSEVEAALQMPFTAYRQEIVRLDVADDGLSAKGVVLLHVQVADGAVGPGAYDEAFAQDGRLFAVTFTKVGGQWLMSRREPTEPVLSLPLPASALFRRLAPVGALDYFSHEFPLFSLRVRCPSRRSPSDSNPQKRLPAHQLCLVPKRTHRSWVRKY